MHVWRCECLSVHLYIVLTRKLRGVNAPFLCMLPVDVTRSSVDNFAIPYVLPVLRMMSYFHTIGPTGRIKHDVMFRRIRQMAVPIGRQTTTVLSSSGQSLPSTISLFFSAAFTRMGQGWIYQGVRRVNPPEDMADLPTEDQKISSESRVNTPRTYNCKLETKWCFTDGKMLQLLLLPRTSSGLPTVALPWTHSETSEFRPQTPIFAPGKHFSNPAPIYIWDLNRGHCFFLCHSPLFSDALIWI